MSTAGSGDSIVFDMKGQTLSVDGTANIDVMNGAVLTIKDSVGNGKISFVDKQACFRAKEGGTINVESGTVEGGWYCFTVFKDSTLNFNGGTAVVRESDGNTISGNGSKLADGSAKYGNTTININGGEIIGGDMAIYHPQQGVLNIKGGKLSGKSVIVAKSGTLNITGGELNATGEYVTAPLPWNNGAHPDGSVILLDENKAYYGHMSLNVTGDALLSSENGNAIRFVAESAMDPVGSSIDSIKLDKISAISKLDNVDLAKVDQSKITIINPVIDVDTDTGIVIDTDTGVIPENAVLDVKPVEKTSEVYTQVEETLKDEAKNFVVFDISILVADQPVQPDGTVTLYIPIPEGYDDAKVVIYRVDETGAKFDYEVEVVEIEGAKYAKFSADHFSYYVLAEKVATTPTNPDVTPPTPGPATAVNNNSVYFAVAMLITLGGVVLVMRKKKVFPF